MVQPHINLSNFESVLNWRNWNKFWRVCMGCYQTLIPYISIGNCNSELIFGMRASFRILYKNMTSYPIISKILFLWRHHFRTLYCVLWFIFKLRIKIMIYSSCIRRWRTVSAISSWISGFSNSFTWKHKQTKILDFVYTG